MNPSLRIAALALLAALSACAVPNDPGKIASVTDPEWHALASGNDAYVRRASDVAVRDRRAALAQKQEPRTAVLACADSRCAPELVFERQPGDVFVVRTAGNICDEIALGSLEYSVAVLNTPTLLVVGHEHCGAVKAAVAGKATGSPHIDAIVARIRPALRAVPADADAEAHLSACVAENVRSSTRDLLERSEILRNAVRDGKLRVWMAVQDLETGRVTRLE